MEFKNCFYSKFFYDKKIDVSKDKYQPSGDWGTQSAPATPHHLQNPKWPLGGPKIDNGVWKGV